MPSRSVWSNGPEWGIVARSALWTLQATLVSTLALILAAVVDGAVGGFFVAVAASVVVAFLLFRQIEALIEQKLPE